MSSSKPHHDQEDGYVEENTIEGKKVWSFKPRAFNIIWGNDSRYWTLAKENSTDGAAELVQVCWLELTGSTPANLTPGKRYQISFKISMKQGAFGWNNCPVFMMAKIGKKGRYRWTKINLSDQACEKKDIPESNFYIDAPATGNNDLDTKLYFGLYEVWTGKWKGGLKIHGATVQEVPSS